MEIMDLLAFGILFLFIGLPLIVGVVSCFPCFLEVRRERRRLEDPRRMTDREYAQLNRQRQHRAPGDARPEDVRAGEGG